MGARDKAAFAASGPAAWRATARPLYHGGGGKTPRTYDFTGGTLPPGATLNRASIGTRFNSSGLLVTESASVPRFDYSFDGSVWSLAGLLVELQMTNLQLATEALNHAGLYSPVGMAASVADAGVAPDGATTAEKLRPDTNNASAHTHRNWHLSAYGFVPTASAQYIFSIFVKAAEYTWIEIWDKNHASGGTTASVYVDLVNGAFGTAGGEILDKWIQNIGNGWYRVSILTAAPSSPGVHHSVKGFYVAEANGDRTFAGNGTDGLYSWGWQTHLGSYPQSYIPNPSTSSTATRLADLVTLNLADGDWDLEVVTPNDTFGGSVTVSGGDGYQFAWEDLSGATTERHVQSITATLA